MAFLLDAAAVPVFVTVMVPLTSTLTSPLTITEVLKSLWLSVFYVPNESPFISTKFLDLSLDLVYFLTDLLFFDIPLSYYYIIIFNPRLRLISSVSAEDIFFL